MSSSPGSTSARRITFLSSTISWQTVVPWRASSIWRTRLAPLEGLGIAVEKGFQKGGDKLRQEGYRVESLAIIESMDAATGEIVFREQD